MISVVGARAAYALIIAMTTSARGRRVVVVRMTQDRYGWGLAIPMCGRLHRGQRAHQNVALLGDLTPVPPPAQRASSMARPADPTERTPPVRDCLGDSLERRAHPRRRRRHETEQRAARIRRTDTNNLLGQATSNRFCEHGRHRVADEERLFGGRANELEVVWERLDPSALADRQIAVCDGVNELTSGSPSDRLGGLAWSQPPHPAWRTPASLGRRTVHHSSKRATLVALVP